MIEENFWAIWKPFSSMIFILNFLTGHRQRLNNLLIFMQVCAAYVWKKFNHLEKVKRVKKQFTKTVQTTSYSLKPKLFILSDVLVLVISGWITLSLGVYIDKSSNQWNILVWCTLLMHDTVIWRAYFLTENEDAYEQLGWLKKCPAYTKYSPIKMFTS